MPAWNRPQGQPDRIVVFQHDGTDGLVCGSWTEQRAGKTDCDATLLEFVFTNSFEPEIYTRNGPDGEVVVGLRVPGGFERDELLEVLESILKKRRQLLQELLDADDLRATFDLPSSEMRREARDAMEAEQAEGTAKIFHPTRKVLARPAKALTAKQRRSA